MVKYSGEFKSYLVYDGITLHLIRVKTQKDVGIQYVVYQSKDKMITKHLPSYRLNLASERISRTRISAFLMVLILFFLS